MAMTQEENPQKRLGFTDKGKKIAMGAMLVASIDAKLTDEDKGKSKSNLTELQKKYDITLWNDTLFCSSKDRRLLRDRGIGMYSKNTVGYESTSSTPEHNGKYVYTTLIPVTAQEGKSIYNDPEGHLAYDLAAFPQDICSKFFGRDSMFIAYRSRWVTVPKEAIAAALALPPDPERSEAYQQGKIKLLKIP